MINKFNLNGMLYGFAIGDALGVPFEFMDANAISLSKKSLKVFNGFMSHNQQPGTWSDDTSMLLALVDANLTNTSSISNYLKWFLNNEYAVDNDVFDIGTQTYGVLDNLRRGKEDRGYFDSPEFNGNGALMRILPLVHFTKDMDLGDVVKVVNYEVSLTHPHIVNLYCCTFFVFFIREVISLLKTKSTIDYYKVYKTTLSNVDKYYVLGEYEDMVKSIRLGVFLNEDMLCGINNGYVVNTLKEVLHHIVFNSKTYLDLVSNCIKHGDDTDTIAAICGGVYGYLNGVESLPATLMRCLRGKDLIDQILFKEEEYGT